MNAAIANAIRVPGAPALFKSGAIATDAGWTVHQSPLR